MILERVNLVHSGDVARFAWSGLSRYQNVPFVEECICSLHNLCKSHRANARKQAKQLRYCLIQAKEYFDAAAGVTLATKPTLLYYSIMSLAISEILLKQTGESSLDAARKHHRHHGLEFRETNFSADANLAAAASSLRAVPITRNEGERFGTFELWHRSCREMPLCGDRTIRRPGIHQSTTTSFDVLLSPADHRLPVIPSAGVTLLECLRRLPGMLNFLSTFGITPLIVRAKIISNVTVFSPDDSAFEDRKTLTIHPSDESLLTDFFDNLKIRVDEVNNIDFIEAHRGGILSMKINNDTLPGATNIPPGSTWNRNEIRLWSGDVPLNEFGYLYVALYVVGNYARYFPDRWCRDVEQNSALAIAVAELIYHAEQRMALLAYGEVARVCFVIDS